MDSAIVYEMESKYVLLGELSACAFTEKYTGYVRFYLWTQEQYASWDNADMRLDALYQLDDTDDIATICFKKIGCENRCCSTVQRMNDFEVIKHSLSVDEFTLVMKMQPDAIQFPFEALEEKLQECEMDLHCKYVQDNRDEIRKMLLCYLIPSLIPITLDKLHHVRQEESGREMGRGRKIILRSSSAKSLVP
jgi:hypothetical protein